MKNLSVREFKKYCDKHKPHCFIYDTENQKWSKVEDTLQMKHEFDEIKIASIRIRYIYLCFRTVSFERVKSVRDARNDSWKFFDVVCHDKPYTIVLR
jgi:hypothetical protein